MHLWKLVFVCEKHYFESKVGGFVWQKWYLYLYGECGEVSWAIEVGKRSFCEFVLYMFWFAKAKALANGLGLGSLEALAVA